MRVSLLINSKDRPHMLARCLSSGLSQTCATFEILVLDDGSAQPQYFKVLKSQFQDVRLRFLRAEQSLGVAEGRNRLMAEAGGDIFCFIDDDAFFQDDTALAGLVSALESNPTAGIIAAKVFDHYPSGRSRLYLPFTQRTIKQNLHLINQPQRISYYLGTCHAIRRSVIERCGGYQSFTKFGEEELDLSYRAIEAGFELLYWPGVVVHHFPQPSVVEKSSPHQHIELYYHTRNRFYLAYKYLPWSYVPVYLSIWLAVYGSRAVRWRALPEFAAGIRDGLRQIATLSRTPLSPAAEAYLRANHGRLWF